VEGMAKKAGFSDEAAKDLAREVGLGMGALKESSAVISSGKFVRDTLKTKGKETTKVIHGGRTPDALFPNK